MKQKIKTYHPNHARISVQCPRCTKEISGWTYQIEWKLYWIIHTVPNERGNECWIEEADMKAAIAKWEQKYELIEINV